MSIHESSYKFNVQMGCGGCADAIRDALKDLKSLNSVDTSIPEQTVFTVVGLEASYDAVLDRIMGAGKTVPQWGGGWGCEGSLKSSDSLVRFVEDRVDSFALQK